MKVVIMGNRSRDEAIDKPLVDKIIDDVRVRYPKLMIVTKSGDKGAGKIIMDRCKAHADGPEFNMMEFNLRHMLQHELPRHEFLKNYNALNAALLEIGEEFHILTEDKPTGVVKDMLERIKELNLPHAVYTPSDTIEAKLPNISQFSGE